MSHTFDLQRSTSGEINREERKDPPETRRRTNCCQRRSHAWHPKRRPIGRETLRVNAKAKEKSWRESSRYGENNKQRQNHRSLSLSLCCHLQRLVLVILERQKCQPIQSRHSSTYFALGTGFHSLFRHHFAHRRIEHSRRSGERQFVFRGECGTGKVGIGGASRHTTLKVQRTRTKTGRFRRNGTEIWREAFVFLSLSHSIPPTCFRRRVQRAFIMDIGEQQAVSPVDVVVVGEKIALDSLDDLRDAFEARLIDIDDVSVEHRWTHQQTEQCVQKNVQELNEFLGLRPDDVHNRLFEIFLVNVMMSTRVALFTNLIVHLEEMSQTIVLFKKIECEQRSTKEWNNEPENEWSRKDAGKAWKEVYDCRPTWHYSRRDSKTLHRCLRDRMNPRRVYRRWNERIVLWGSFTGHGEMKIAVDQLIVIQQGKPLEEF